MTNRDLLLRALDDALREGDAATLSIRAISRRAEVSHNLPTVLFGDRRGLLTAYAAQSFRALGECLADAAEGYVGPAGLAAVGQAYVTFALEHPHRFELMFRQDQLNADDPDYLAACAEGFAPLADVMRALIGASGLAAAEGRDVGAAAWAMVHGLAMLQLGGHLGARSREKDVDAYVERVTHLFAERMTGR